MAKSLKLSLDFQVIEGTQSNNPEDLTRVKGRAEESDVSELFRKQEAIPDATTDLAIALPDAASDYLVIFTDQEISIKLNGSATAITLKPKIATKKTPVTFLRGTISSLSISNASGAVANVDIVAVNI